MRRLFAAHRKLVDAGFSYEQARLLLEMQAVEPARLQLLQGQQPDGAGAPAPPSAWVAAAPSLALDPLEQRLAALEAALPQQPAPHTAGAHSGGGQGHQAAGPVATAATSAAAARQEGSPPEPSAAAGNGIAPVPAAEALLQRLAALEQRLEAVELDSVRLAVARQPLDAIARELSSSGGSSAAAPLADGDGMGLHADASTWQGALDQVRRPPPRGGGAIA
jgi:hypothetical protein